MRIRHPVGFQPRKGGGKWPWQKPQQHSAAVKRQDRQHIEDRQQHVQAERIEEVSQHPVLHRGRKMVTKTQSKCGEGGDEDVRRGGREWRR